MGLDINGEVIKFDEANVGNLNEIIRKITQNATGVVFTDTTPDLSKVQSGKLVVFDDGVNTNVYVRSGKDNLVNLNSTANGTVVGYSYTQSTANTASGTNAPVMDDTVPTSSEVGLISTLTVTHTPKSATNILRIELFPNHGVGANNNAILALFKDSETDAIAATFMTLSDPNGSQFPPLVYHMVAGGTSAITFKMFGGSSAEVFTINSMQVNARMGASSIAYISVMEIQAS